MFLEDDELHTGDPSLLLGGHSEPLLGSSGFVSSGKTTASPLCVHGRQYQHQHSTDTSTRSSITPDLWTWTHGSSMSMSALISTIFKCTVCTPTLSRAVSQFTCWWHLEGRKKEGAKKKITTFYKMEYSWESRTWEFQTMWPHSMSFWKRMKDIQRFLFVWTSPFYLITTVEWSTYHEGRKRINLKEVFKKRDGKKFVYQEINIKSHP